MRRSTRVVPILLGVMVLIFVVWNWSSHRNLGERTQPNEQAQDPVDTRSSSDASSAAPPIAALISRGLPLELMVTWRHTGVPAVGAIIRLTRSAPTAAPTATTVTDSSDSLGVAALEYPEEWTKARIEVELEGAAPYSRALALPSSGRVTILLEAAHSLFGVIYSGDSKEPIPNVEVHSRGFRGEPEFDRGQSNSRGEYELALSRGGEHSLLFRAMGHADRIVNIQISEIGASELDVRMEPAFEALVRVVDSADRPIASAQVTPSLSDQLGNIFDSSNTVATDQAGLARIPAISRKNPQSLMVTHPDYDEIVSKIDRIPPSQDQAHITVVLNDPVGDRQIVEGYVTSQPGHPLEGIAVRWRRENSASAHAGGLEDPGEVTRTNEKGYYRLEVTDDDDQCVVAVAGPGWAPIVESDARYDANSPTTRVDFTLEPGNWLAGRVIDENGQPVPAVVITVVPSGIPGAEWYPELARVETTDESGAFSFGDLPTSRIQVHVKPPPGTRWSYWDDRGKVVTNQELEIVLHALGQIPGRVIDRHTGDPIPSFTVQRLPFEGGFWESASRHSFNHPEGRFVLADINRPAQCRIRVHAEGYLSGEFSPIEPTVTGAPADPVAELTVELDSVTTLSGRVIDAGDGTVVSEATLVFGIWSHPAPIEWSEYVHKDMLNYQRLSTDDEGRFELVDVPGGSLLIRKLGYRRLILSAEELRSMKRAGSSLAIELAVAETISGTYVTPEGPVEGHRVGILEKTQLTNDHGYPVLTPFGYTKTDHEGRFAWQDLMPGTFVLEQLFSSHLRDQWFRRTLTLEPGDHLDLNIGDGFGSLTLRGHLFDSDGKVSHDSFSLILRPQFEWTFDEIACHVGPENKGRYQFERLQPGTYTVEARSWRRGRFPLPDLEVDADTVQTLLLPTQ